MKCECLIWAIFSKEISQKNTKPMNTVLHFHYRQKKVSDELALNYCLISIIMHVNSISNELPLSGGRKHLQQWQLDTYFLPSNSVV